MIGLLIVTHGSLGQEILKTAEFIIGVLEGCLTVSIDSARSPEFLRESVGTAIRALDKGAGVLVLTDMFGGTPSNISLSFLEEGRVEDWAALVERNLNRAGRGSSPSDRFQKYYQLAQVYQELGRNPDVERNLDSALANRDSGVSAENIYAVAQSYKRLLKPEKYRAALILVRDTGDPFWQQVAADELKAETS